MLRGWHPNSSAMQVGMRHITIGGRHSRGGFRQPLGKHPQVKQGTVEGVPRRIPGTTKVTYTNKKGRTFSFSVPVSELTHPQVTLESAAGTWREMDTSFCELGDIEDDMPSPVDECLRGGSSLDKRLIQEVRERFVSFCREYVLMDTSGMKSTILSTELNAGPDYEHYDRRLRRKRHWLAIRHRFEDVRYIIWPDVVEETARGDSAQADVSLTNPSLTAGEMLEALLWLDAASTFCVRKVHPSDLGDKSEFLPLDLQREVEVVACHARRDLNFFDPSATSLEQFTACAALCVNHRVPFSLFFPAQDVCGDASVSTGQCIVANAPSPHTALGAVRIMALISEGSGSDIGKTIMFSDAFGAVTRFGILRGLSRVMSVEAFGCKDALENVNESELCIILHFCAEVREQNAAFFRRYEASEENSDPQQASFLAKYQQLSQIALARCKRLLYHPDSPRAQVMSEDGYIPLVELQRHAEGTNKAALIHYNLGIRSAQGMRRVALGAQSSARLAELVSRLEEASARVSGNTLVNDLVHHLSHKAAAGKMSLTLREVNTLLPLLSRMRRESPNGALDARFDRVFNAIDTAIGAAMRHNCTLDELLDLTEGLAACEMVPSALKQVEMVLIRSVMMHECSPMHLRRMLQAMFTLMRTSVPQVLLQSVASRVADYIKEASHMDSSSSNGGGDEKVKNHEECEQLLELLVALGKCAYGALPGLVTIYWEAQLIDSMQLNPRLRCSYASLLASAAFALKKHDKRAWEGLADESHRLFMEYTRCNKENDIGRFAECVTGLAVLTQIKDNTNSSDVAFLKEYLSATSLELKSCEVIRVQELTDLLGRTLEWSEALGVVAPDVVIQLEKALFVMLENVSHTAPGVGIPDELVTAACCLVDMSSASLELRKAAAGVVGGAIVHAEEALETLRSGAPTQVRPGHSFDVAALASAERENVYKNSILQYCAALQRSGMSTHVEELWS
ncbi:hypothetical protein, conserved [Trypanosoma brucei gambiense DAL972]|uniref:Uncharacterized protein n=1 Tax=Trypanosoma brucei gambiense (strain MHOM/CI/86/DAL972) TaxID=679716 RepID=C9ZYE8_TRYB9|nr:hypothetical protein, conserved [Trypanosoma brucei gambiense DAL972]CBH14447.1 hypothetical protein, conserved [Trypanosoma brucei gambiense DAL972]|eukprot:XP_011776713.1 hypothetical protein, conserved [Trypanosoma brucei gambiense DAL972]